MLAARLALLLILAAPAGCKGPARLAGERGRHAVIEDTDGALAGGRYRTWGDIQPWLEALRPAWREAGHPEAQFLVLLQTFPIGRGYVGFFQPVANDVSGIGYEHQARLGQVPAALFDGTPESDLRGVADLGDLGRMLANADFADELFQHELGHAWSSFVWSRRDAAFGPELLRPDGGHWSQYLETEGSPIGGGHFVGRDDGTFEVSPRPPGAGYCPLDLYLMGLLPAAEVPPTFLIEAVSETGTTADGTPFVRGRARSVTIDEILAAEGPRDPPAAAGAGPVVLPVGFALVVPGGQAPAPDLEAAADELIARLAANFAAATGDRARIEIVTGDRL